MLGTDILDKDVQICVKESTKNKLEAMAKRQYIDVDTLINNILKDNEELRNQVRLQQLEGNFAKSIVSKKNSTNIPSVIRRQFNIKPGNTLFWDILDGEIVLKVDEPKKD